MKIAIKEARCFSFIIVACASSVLNLKAQCSDLEGGIIQSQRKKKYVIVGAGVAGQACLSKLLSGRKPEAAKDILLIDQSVHILQSIKDKVAHLETTNLPITNFSVEEQTLQLASGETITFDKCLLAMGKETARIDPRLVMQDCSPEHIIHLQGDSSSSGEQLVHLRKLVSSHRHVTLLGGSWNSLALARYTTYIE
jgi:hypothetical protein